MDYDHHETNERLVAMEARFDAILPTLATKSDIAELRGELRAEMHQMNANFKSWIAATVIAIVGTMLAAIMGISQTFKDTSKTSTPPAPIIIQIPAAPTAANPSQPQTVENHSE